VLAYLIYDGIQSKIEFKKEAKSREEVVHKRLENIAEAQKEFKNEKGRFANNFNELLHFLNHDSLTIVKAIGNVPDTLTEVEAVERGIVIRDTLLVPASTIFPKELAIDSLPIVPFSKGSEFKMKADVIEKNKVNVNVFEAYTTFEEVYTGLKTKSENVDLDARIQIGSLTEPITTGNWK
jgi:chromosome segregation ATPase